MLNRSLVKWFAERSSWQSFELLAWPTASNKRHARLIGRFHIFTFALRLEAITSRLEGRVAFKKSRNRIAVSATPIGCFQEASPALLVTRAPMRLLHVYFLPFDYELLILPLLLITHIHSPAPFNMLEMKINHQWALGHLNAKTPKSRSSKSSRLASHCTAPQCEPE